MSSISKERKRSLSPARFLNLSFVPVIQGDGSGAPGEHSPLGFEQIFSALGFVAEVFCLSSGGIDVAIDGSLVEGSTLWSEFLAIQFGRRLSQRYRGAVPLTLSEGRKEIRDDGSRPNQTIAGLATSDCRQPRGRKGTPGSHLE